MVIRNFAKKAFVLLLVAFIFITHLSLCVSADNAYGSSEKLDYVGLLTRMEKYQLDEQEWIFRWNYKVFLQLYPYVAEHGCIYYLYPKNEYKDGNDFYDSERCKKIRKKSVQDSETTGFPLVYYYVRLENISREDFVERLIEYDPQLTPRVVSLVADAVYSEDARLIIETLMAPEMVINPITYNSDTPKHRKVEYYSQMVTIDNFEDVFITPDGIINTPLEILDTWNYSDEYWYDYYSFIDFLNKIDLDKSWSYVAVNANMAQPPERSAELARRLALYSERVGKSPDTGDAGGARVAVLAATTVLAAMIPAGGLTVWRRRKRVL